MIPETYEEFENEEVNVAPESTDGDDEDGDGFLEDED